MSVAEVAVCCGQWRGFQRGIPVLQWTQVAVQAKVLQRSSSDNSADNVFCSKCVAASDHQVVADAHFSADTICFFHQFAKQRPIVMHFKKCGSSEHRTGGKQGFEHDDTDVMVGTLCATEFARPHSDT